MAEEDKGSTMPRRLGAVLAHARKRCGLSQVQVAAALNNDQTTISGWELGKAVPPLEVVDELARLYGQPILGLLAEAGFEGPESDVVMAILADRALSPETRGHMIAIYRSFAADLAS